MTQLYAVPPAESTRWRTAILVRPLPHTSSTISVRRLTTSDGSGNCRNLGQRHQASGAFHLGREIDRRRQDVLNVERFGEHPAGDDSAARDHDHAGHRADAANLRQQNVDQFIDICPRENFMPLFSGLSMMLYLHRVQEMLIIITQLDSNSRRS